jgi:hypothetical protein
MHHPPDLEDDGFAPIFWTAFTRSANAMIVVDLDRRIVAANEASTVLSSLVGAMWQSLLDDPAEAIADDAWRRRVSRGSRSGGARSAGPTARRG